MENYNIQNSDHGGRGGGEGGGQKSAYYVHEKVIRVKLKSLFLPRR